MRRGPLPAIVFAGCAGEPGAVLLETQTPSLRERTSIIARQPERILTVERAVEEPGVFDTIEAAARDRWLVGYLGYGLRTHVETLPDRNPSLVPFPDLWLGIYPGLWCYDHLRGVWRVEGRPPPLPEPATPPAAMKSRARLVPVMPKEDYVQAVKRAQAYITAGDIYQVNLTQPFRVEPIADPWELYLALGRVQPVPYAAFLCLGAERCLLSGSPELFLRRRGARVTTRPMKGTAPRGRGPREDRIRRRELRASAKDRAENVMIVDLMRHDLGKVAAVGSVRVANLFTVEGYRTLFQMTSKIQATLREGVGVAGLLRAVFPPGSVTGTPKKRACEIIEQLECYRRSVYTGAIGLIAPSGDLTLSVAIRTVAVAHDRGLFGVGGAILADSDPEAEYRECLVKAQALLRALGIGAGAEPGQLAEAVGDLPSFPDGGRTHQ